MGISLLSTPLEVKNRRDIALLISDNILDLLVLKRFHNCKVDGRMTDSGGAGKDFEGNFHGLRQVL